MTLRSLELTEEEKVLLTTIRGLIKAHDGDARYLVVVFKPEDPALSRAISDMHLDAQDVKDIIQRLGFIAKEAMASGGVN